MAKKRTISKPPGKKVKKIYRAPKPRISAQTRAIAYYIRSHPGTPLAELRLMFTASTIKRCLKIGVIRINLENSEAPVFTTEFGWNLDSPNSRPASNPE